MLPSMILIVLDCNPHRGHPEPARSLFKYSQYLPASTCCLHCRQSAARFRCVNISLACAPACETSCKSCRGGLQEHLLVLMQTQHCLEYHLLLAHPVLSSQQQLMAAESFKVKTNSWSE